LGLQAGRNYEVELATNGITRGSFPARAAEGDPLPRYAVGFSWRDDSLIEYTPMTHAEARPRRTTGWPASRERLVSKRSIVFPWIAEARDFLHQFPDL
jgi:hypothetical protein